MEDIFQQSHNIEDWTQLDEAESSMQLDISGHDPETFLQDLMQWESSMAPLQPHQPLVPSPTPSGAMFSASERPSQFEEDPAILGATLFDSRLFNIDGLDMPQLSAQGTRWFTIEKGQHHCPVCNATFQGGGSAVRLHINRIHIEKEQMDIKVLSSSAGRPKTKATFDHAERPRKKRKTMDLEMRTSLPNAYESSFNPDYISLVEFRILQNVTRQKEYRSDLIAIQRELDRLVVLAESLVLKMKSWRKKITILMANYPTKSIDGSTVVFEASYYIIAALAVILVDLVLDSGALITRP
ncbi:hypothetical protein P171DRAFT_468928 [Karstenula rhodostoma CBS 690.94]|uniref:Uncharacterized protein n=1 Tax=Karstenula rhodostoma CBS 690.94 TaxID=1392251 RepID=A0A9P4UG35_9PLEO|nr:hypothetical protein P171DRAFT_468928 [Karstenula rhodostoma CBS 690.94]